MSADKTAKTRAIFSNVAVGVDEQGSWRDALALAKQLTREDGRLTLAHVDIFRADFRLRRGYTTEDEAAEKHRAEKLLESALSKAGIEAQLRSRGSTFVGRGRHELVEHLGADLLVVGSSRQGLLGRVLLRT
ncbi:MAG: universal stress protein [Solirubrobacteraceae bacterium]